jgi:predicted nucleic acid-binding protein
VIAVDTSVVVPAFAAWHEAHDTAMRLLADDPVIPAHVALETYSVLTRLPVPHRVPGPIVVEYLDRVFPPRRRLTASAELQAGLPARCAALGIDGGAVYDVLIGAIALEHAATLATRDLRAAPFYRAVGVEVRLQL